MIYLDGHELVNLHIGTNEIQRVMLGDKVVWENAIVIDLGEGKSFDVSSIYSRYGDLTNDNFFILSASSCSASQGIRMYPTDSRQYVGFSAYLIKSYNSSTGILSCYNAIRNNGGSVLNSGNVRVVLVANPSKLIYLGSGTSFNVSSYAGYQNFTVNNFLIKSTGNAAAGGMFYPQGAVYDDSGKGTSTISKSYNSSNGLVTSNIRMSSYDTSGIYHWFDWSDTAGVELYLNLKP